MTAVMRPRTVPSAEVFLAESVMDVLAETADRAYAENLVHSGVLLGTFYQDSRGIYASVTGARPGDDPDGAVGRYRAEPGSGCAPAESDLSAQQQLFGTGKSYLMVLTGADSAFIVIKAEGGSLQPVRFVISEGC